MLAGKHKGWLTINHWITVIQCQRLPNSFDLPGSINVAPLDDFEFYKGEQIELCGSFAEIDIDAEAHAIPLPARSQNYVISSHVVEHLPDLMAAFLEWDRLLVHGGCVFMIFPKREAHPGDVGRPVSLFSEFLDAHRAGVTVDTWDYEANPVPGGRRGH